MTGKPVVLRELASKDVAEAIDFYIGEQAWHAAEGFVLALERACLHLSRNPGTGSSRYAHEMPLPGLRFWPLTNYPQLVFYVEREDHVDIWRVLHGQRDIAAWLQDSGLA